MFTLRLNTMWLCLVLLFIAGCSEYDSVDCEDYDYASCIGIEPDSFDVEILLTQRHDSDFIPFVLYRGKYDPFGAEPEVILVDTSLTALYVVRLPFNYDYSVKATYQRNGETHFALDGVRLEKRDRKVCDSLCWEITGKVIDVRLKD